MIVLTALTTVSPESTSLKALSIPPIHTQVPIPAAFFFVLMFETLDGLSVQLEEDTYGLKMEDCEWELGQVLWSWTFNSGVCFGGQ